MEDEELEGVKELLKNRYLYLLVGVVLVGSYLRFREAFFTGMWVDEGRHARIGFELADHLLEYRASWLGDITAFPPVYTYLLGISSAVLGKTEFAVRIVSPLVGTIGVVLGYLLGREMWDRDAGIVLAALLAVNPLFWFLSTRMLVGATLTTVYTATVLALYVGMSDRNYYRYGLYLLGPLTALALITKQPAYTLGLLIPGYFVWRNRDQIMEFFNNLDDFRDTEFYTDILQDRNYYIGAGLGLLTILPWVGRNISSCGEVLCGASRAVSFAEVTQKPAWESTGGPFFYFLNMPSIITIPATALLVGIIGYYVIRKWDMDQDRMIKILAGTLVLNLAAYLVFPRLLPGILLLSIAFFAPTDKERLLWGWIALGIGIMSIPVVKVNRYVVFVIPALLAVVTFNTLRASERLRDMILEDKGTRSYRAIAALIVTPIIVMSLVSGLSMTQNQGFQALEPAGEWISDNTPEDAVIAGSSPTQTRFYAYPRQSLKLPNDEAEFENFLATNEVDYLLMDVYERAQPHWSQTGLPPYRLPVKTVQEIRGNEVTAEEVANSYGKPPDYLQQVQNFGDTRIPLTKSNQPQVMVYRVNQTSLTSQ